MLTKPLCIQKKVVASSRLFTIEQLHLKFSNGVECNFERIQADRHYGVLIVPITHDDNFLLIKEYSAGIQDYILAFPKGLLKPGEDVNEGANREIQEEVHMGAKNLTHLKTLILSPSYFAAKMDVVLATDLYPASLPGDEPEPLEVIPWPINNMDGLLDNKDFSDSRSVAALLLIGRMIINNKLKR